MNLNYSGAGFPFLFVEIGLVLVAIVHLFLAIGVYGDAKALHDSGKKTRFVSPFMWGILVLGGGLLHATGYWLIHHSSLSSYDS
jgi:hypothetical protein